MTLNAKYILEIINHSDGHLTAEEIYLQLKQKKEKVVLATVYNNLSSLQKQGFIRKISVEGFPDRYDRVKRHDHLVCKECGKLSDITLEDLTEQLQSQVSIPMISYDLRINYICEECLNNMKKENGGNVR